MIKGLVSIIVVNLNGEKFIRSCLSSVKENRYPKKEVIVIDNGSTDKSLDLIRKEFPEIVIHEAKENLGFVGGNNLGEKIAKGEFLLLLNNDTRISNNLIEVMVKEMKSDEQIGVLQPKIIFEKTGRLQAGGSFLTLTGFLYHWGFSQDPFKKEFCSKREIFSANGACILTRKSIVENIGLFDPDFFAYFEESDFCWRVWLSGKKVLYFPEVSIYHKGSLTSSRFGSLFVQYHSFKNRICSLIKNLSFSEMRIILPIHLLVCNGLSLAFLLYFQFSRSLVIQKAIWWNILNLKSTLKKRKRIQLLHLGKKNRSILKNLIIFPGWQYFRYFFNGLKNYRG